MKYYHMKPLQWPQFVTRDKENHEILPYEASAMASICYKRRGKSSNTTI